MTWKPVPQPPCTEPCCTGEAFTEHGWPDPVTVPDACEDRECEVVGCIYCKPISFRSGGGARLPFGHRKA